MWRREVDLLVLIFGCEEESGSWLWLRKTVRYRLDFRTQHSREQYVTYKV